MSGSESSGVCVLFEFDNFPVADTEGHDPAVVEHATRALDSSSGPTGDEDGITLRDVVARFEAFDFNCTAEFFKEVSHAGLAVTKSISSVPPASSNSTCVPGSAASLDATIGPDVPDPQTMKS